MTAISTKWICRLAGCAWMEVASASNLRWRTADDNVLALVPCEFHNRLGIPRFKSAGSEPTTSDADIDRVLGSIKSRAGSEQIERRPDHRRARGGPGGLVTTSPHPFSETCAANGPSFPMVVCYEVGECDPGGSVKQLLTEHHLVEHRS